MSSVKVILFISKLLKNGEHPIMLRVTKDRKTNYISVGASCHISLWDEKKNLPRKKHPLYHELSVLIDTKLLEAKKLLIDLKNEEGTFSSDDLLSTLKGAAIKVQVLTFFDTYIKELRKQKRIGTADVFTFTRNSISKFREGKDLEFSQVTAAFLWKYHEWLLQRGIVLNSISVYMRTFQRLVNLAKERKLLKNDKDAFKEFGLAKYKKAKTRKRAIAKEDILRIASFAAVPDSLLFHARNYFMFSYYCLGINFIDMAYLKWENIREGRLYYVRQKTKKDYNMALLEPATEIMDYYRTLYYTGEEGYIFPIINPEYTSPQSISNRCKKVLRQTNASLKEIAKELGLSELKLTTYVARHSFATVLKRSGLSVAVISEMMGHDSEHTTQIYLDSFENKVLDEAAKALL